MRTFPKRTPLVLLALLGSGWIILLLGAYFPVPVETVFAMAGMAIFLVGLAASVVAGILAFRSLASPQGRQSSGIVAPVAAILIGFLVWAGTLNTAFVVKKSLETWQDLRLHEALRNYFSTIIEPPANALGDEDGNSGGQPSGLDNQEGGSATDPEAGTCRTPSWTNVIDTVRATASIDRELQGAFRPFNLHPYAPLHEWIELQAATAGLETRFDDAAWSAGQHHVLLIGSSALEHLPKRYFIGWMFHLFGLKGRLVGDALVVSAAGEGDPIFQCCQETTGPWRRQLDKALHTQLTVTGEPWAVSDLIQYVSFKTDLPVLLDRPLLAKDDNYFPPPLNQKVQLAFTNAPAEKVLSEFLNNAGLGYEIQGGVVFIKESRYDQR